MTIIHCDVCHKPYTAIFRRDLTQAVRCSSEVTDGRLVGHYGSEIADMQVFDFVGEVPADGKIYCDGCITRGLANGTLVRADGNLIVLADPAETDMMIRLLDESVPESEAAGRSR